MTKKLSRIVALMLAVIMSFSMLLVPVEAASFKDVSNKAWYKAAVDYVAERGWMAGVSSTTFAPNMKVTRGMAVTVLAKVAEADLSAYEPAFADTEAGKWYTKAAAWAADKGIVAGVGDGMFAPNRVITRQDLAAILNKFIKKQDYQITLGEPVSFNDMDSVAGYATEAVSFCAAAGLVSGFEDSTFRPQQTATRAHLAVMMMKLDQLIQGYAQPMPAQSFNGEAGEDMTVSVNAPEGALPEDTEMTLSRVTDKTALLAIANQVNGDIFAAANITFSKDGADLEPASDVEVQISMDGLEEIQNPVVIHVKTDGTVETINSDLISVTRGGQKALRFYSKDFSVYAILDGDITDVPDQEFRARYEFYNSDGTPYEFQDITGQLLNSQILKDGEILEDVGIPTVGSSQNAKFVGWFVINVQIPRSCCSMLFSLRELEDVFKMKNYKPYPGIVHTKICGVHVLIPTREAYSHCDTIQKLPLIWAMTWNGLVRGKTLEETVEVHRILTRKSKEEILQQLEYFYELLLDKGFLMVVADDEDQENTTEEG